MGVQWEKTLIFLFKNKPKWEKIPKNRLNNLLGKHPLFLPVYVIGGAAIVVNVRNERD